MEEFLQDENLRLFFTALCRVRRDYVTYLIYTGSSIDDKEHCERVFAYELYRVWANLLKERNSKFILNGEIGKLLDKFDESLKEMEKSKRYPDLVLHQGQGSNSGHAIICEIKKASKTENNNLKDDLIKLNAFTKGKHRYRWGVLLIYGNKSQGNEEPAFDFTKFKNDYSRIFSDFEHKEDILIVSLEYNEKDEDDAPEPEIRIETLNYILNSNNHETFTFNRSFCAMFAGGACPVSGLHLS